MRKSSRKTSSRSHKKKRRSYSTSAPRYSVDVHVTTGGTKRKK